MIVTAKGRARSNALHEVASQVDVELRALLTEREVDVLGKTLMRIHDHFTAVKEDEEEARRVRQR